MKRGTELRSGLRLLVMALVFLALSCEGGSGGDGCGDCNMDALITGCSDGCGAGCKPIGDGCLGSCILGGSGDGCGCGAGEGCDLGLDGCMDCGDVGPYAYPNGALVAEQAVQVHVTGSLFNFVNQHIMDIIKVAAGDALGINQNNEIVVCLPRDTDISVGKICTGGFNCSSSGSGPNNGCALNVKIRSVVIRPQAPNKLSVDVRINGLSSRMETSSISGCNRMEIKKNSNDVVVTLGTALLMNPADRHTELYIAGNDLAINIDAVSVDLAYHGSSWSGGNIGCTIGGGILEGVVNGLKGTAVNMIRDGIGALTCRGCQTNADCGGGATCNQTEKVCKYPSGHALAGVSPMCQGIQLGVQAGLDAGSLLQSMIPGAEGALGVKAFLGNYAKTITGGGVQLGARLGVAASPDSLCVPYRPAPIQPGANSCRNGTVCPELEELNNIAGTVNGTPYHIGVGIAMSGLNLALWSAYNSGLLCLSLDATSLMPDMIHTELIGGFIGSIGQATEGKRQPLIIQLRPQEEPRVNFRADEGNGAVIEVIIQKIEIDLYTIVHERHARLVTIAADLNIPIGLMASGANLELALGDLAELIDPASLTVKNGELVNVAQVQSLINNLPSLIGALGGDMLSIPPIEIPEIQGIALRFAGPGLGILNDNGTTTPAALGAFINMGFAEGGGAASHVEPVLVDFSVDMPEPNAFRQEMLRRVRNNQVVSYTDYLPAVTVRMDAIGEAVAANGAEYAYSVNGGPWSFWKQGPTITLDNPALALEREHEIRIRARAKGDASTGSDVFETISFVHDYTRPAVKVEAQGGRILVEATDNVYSSDQLLMSYSVNGGSFSARSALGAIDLAPYLMVGEAKVEVHVFDPSGNVAAAVRTFGVSENKAAPVAAGADDVDGCASAQGNAGLFALISILALVGFRRRRSERKELAMAMNPYMTLGFALIVALGVLSSGCKKSTPSCNPVCESWQMCNTKAGVCEASPCNKNEDCGSAGMCVNGFCVPATACNDHYDCENWGEVCIDGYCGPSQCEVASDCNISCSGDLLPYCDWFDDNGAGACMCASPLALGQHGAFTRVVAPVDGSTAYAFAFNATYGDIMFSEISDQGTFNWKFIDGLPTGGFVAGPPSGPREGIVEPGPIAGRYIAAALEEGEEGKALHVVYQATTNRQGAEPSLRYARGVINGSDVTWTKFDIEKEAVGGLYNEIVIDTERGGIAILSMFRDIFVPGEGAPNQFHTELRYYYAATLTPTSADDFVVRTTVDQEEDARPCAALCTVREVCDGATNSCVTASTHADCSNCVGGEVCVTVDGAPTCVPGAPGQAGVAYVPYGVGLFTSSVIVGDQLHVAYYDRAHGNLKYSIVGVVDGVLSPTAGVIIDGETATADTGDIGWWVKTAVAPSGQVVIFYQDASRGALKAAVPALNRVYLIDRGLYYDVDRAVVEINVVGGSPQPIVNGNGFDIFYGDATAHVVRMTNWPDVTQAPATLTQTPIIWGGTQTAAQIKADMPGALSYYLNVVRAGNLEVMAGLGLLTTTTLNMATYANVNRTPVDPEEGGGEGETP